MDSMMKALWSWVIVSLGLGLCPAAGAGTITYYHNDLAGTPIVATDGSGQVIWRESYRPYGERLTNSAASADNKIWFTSRRQDVETGLVYMGARYYDPVIGRFISTDPSGFNEENVHSHNRYAYANNNPYRYVDPDGRNPRVLLLVASAAYRAGTAAGLGTLGAMLGAAAWDLRQRVVVLLNENAGADGTKGASTGEEADNGQADGQRDATRRPSRVRKGTEQANWENAENGENGGKLCPTCGKEVRSQPDERNKDWDNDHNPAWRDRDLTGKDRKGVLDEYNRDTRLRCINCNRSDNGD